MLEVKDAVFPSPEQWHIIVRGTRNAYKSWDKSDSKMMYSEKLVQEGPYNVPVNVLDFKLGPNDKRLLKNLCNADGGEPSHSKFLRQLPVTLEIKAPLYWFKQFDTYKVGTTTQSESSMHTLTKYPYSLKDFSTDQLENAWGLVAHSAKDFLEHYTIPYLNALMDEYRQNKDKTYWDAINKLLPQSYNQTRTCSLNYEVLRTIVRQREGHKLGEWKSFIDWIRNNVPMGKELIFNEWPKEDNE